LFRIFCFGISSEKGKHMKTRSGTLILLTLLSTSAFSATLTTNDALGWGKVMNPITGFSDFRKGYDISGLESGDYVFTLSFTGQVDGLWDAEYQFSTDPNADYLTIVANPNPPPSEADTKYVTNNLTGVTGGAMIPAFDSTSSYNITLDGSSKNYLSIRQNAVFLGSATISYEKAPAVPLPSTIWLFTCGLGSLFATVKRRVAPR